MTTLLLARHGTHGEVGRVLSGRSDVPLDATGEAEADALARRLDRIGLAAIHSSPRARTRQTAAAVAARQGLAVEPVGALDEVDFGSWAGQSFAALGMDPAWGRWNERRGSAVTPGGETMVDAVARAVAHLNEIEGEGPVLCVSHCDIIRGVVAHYLGLPLDHLLRFDCDPASLTTLETFTGGARLVTLNERAA